MTTLTRYLATFFSHLLNWYAGEQDGSADTRTTGIPFVNVGPWEGEDTGLPDGHRPRYAWAIILGHGPATAGKRSPKYPDRRTVRMDGKDLDRYYEYAANREVGRRLIAKMERAGLVHYTPMPLDGNHGNALVERVAKANAWETDLPKIGLNIHSNAGPSASVDHFTDNSVRGIETWHYYGSVKGIQYAEVFQRHLLSGDANYNRQHVVSGDALSERIHRTVDRGLRSKQDGQFYVLSRTTFPNVLIEPCFYNNRFDLAKMSTPEYLDMVAGACFAAIVEIETYDPPLAAFAAAPDPTGKDGLFDLLLSIWNAATKFGEWRRKRRERKKKEAEEERKNETS